MGRSRKERSVAGQPVLSSVSSVTCSQILSQILLPWNQHIAKIPLLACVYPYSNFLQTIFNFSCPFLSCHCPCFISMLPFDARYLLSATQAPFLFRDFFASLKVLACRHPVIFLPESLATSFVPVLSPPGLISFFTHPP